MLILSIMSFTLICEFVVHLIVNPYIYNFAMYLVFLLFLVLCVYVCKDFGLVVNIRKTKYMKIECH